MDKDISYLAFTLGFDIMHNLLVDAEIYNDEAYDYCVRLATEFYKSTYDDEEDPVYERLTNFVDDKLEEIIEELESWHY